MSFQGRARASYYHLRLLALGLEVQLLELPHEGVVIPGDLATLAHAADAHVVHQDLPRPREGEGQLPLVLRLERGQPVAVRGTDDHEVGVGAVVPQVQVLLVHHGLLRDALHAQALGRPRPQGRELGLEPGERFLVVVVVGRAACAAAGAAAAEGLGAGLARLVDDLGEGHAVGREDARVAVEDDAADAELGGDVAGVLAPRAAEGGEDVLARLEAAGLGEGADGPAHGLVGDVEEAVGDLVRGHGGARGGGRGGGGRGGGN